MREGVEHVSLLVSAFVADAVRMKLCASPESAEHVSACAQLIKTCQQLQSQTPASLSELNSSVSEWSDEVLERIDLARAMVMHHGKIELQKVVALCQNKMVNVVIPDDKLQLPDYVLALDTYEQIDATKVKEMFAIDITKDISDRAVKLDECLNYVKSTAADLGVQPTDLADLTSCEASYRNAIRWLITGNVLYSLVSKAVVRAVTSGGQPSAKAAASLQDPMRVAADNQTELPPGLQAIVTKVLSGGEKAAE